MTRAVFVSHANADKPRLRTLIEALLDENIPLWIDRPEEIGLDERFLRCGRIRSGADWRNEIGNALRQAAGVLFVLSRQANSRERSDELFREFEYAAQRDVLVMVRIDSLSDTELFPAFRVRQALDLSGMIDGGTPDRATQARFQIVLRELRERLLVDRPRPFTLETATPTDQPTAKPSRSPVFSPLRLPRLVPYLTDRTEQQRLFAEVLQSMLTRKDIRPLTFFAQGKEEDCLDSFVEQIRYTRLPSLLDANALKPDIIFKTLSWIPSDDTLAAKGDPQAALADLQAQVADVLGLPPNASAQTIANTLQAGRACWFFHVNAEVDAWKNGTCDALRAWIDWWAGLDLSRLMHPVVTIVSMALPSGWLSRWVAAGAVRRIHKDVRAMQTGNRLGGALHVLPPFRRLRFKDFEPLIRDYGDDFDHEVLRKRLRQQFWVNWTLRGRTMSMYDAAAVVKRLLTDPVTCVRNA